MVKEGDKAPAFELVQNGGTKVKLSQFKGKTVVLYFYPKDDTSGCTKQAVDFSEKIADFHEIGAEIIGISPDSVKSHEKFTDKHGLKVVLLADEDKKPSRLMAFGQKKRCMDAPIWASTALHL